MANMNYPRGVSIYPAQPRQPQILLRLYFAETFLARYTAKAYRTEDTNGHKKPSEHGDGTELAVSKQNN